MQDAQGRIVLPDAESFADLFRYARFLPGNEGKGYHCSQMRGESIAHAMTVGGKRDHYTFRPETHEQMRRHNGGVFHSTWVEPTQAVADAWRKTMGPLRGDRSQGFVLGYFEIVRRTDSLLVVANDQAHIGYLWMALLPLEAASTFWPLYFPEDRALIERERAAEQAAWGHLVERERRWFMPEDN